MQMEDGMNNDTVGMQFNHGVAPRDMYGGAIKDITNPFKQLESIEQHLKGYRKIEGVWKQVDKPLLNDEGINSLMTRMQAYLTINTTMTDLTDAEIRNVIHEINYDITSDLMINRKEYAIKKGDQRTKISKMILIPIFLALKRSNNGGERRFWKGSLNENINYNGAQKSRNWLGWKK